MSKPAALHVCRETHSGPMPKGVRFCDCLPWDKCKQHKARVHRAEIRTDATQLLTDCRTALNDWIRTYASEFCDKAAVKEAHERIAEGGGTLAYVGKLLQRLNATIEAASEPSPLRCDCEAWQEATGIAYHASDCPRRALTL